MADNLITKEVAADILAHFAVPYCNARWERVRVCNQLIDQSVNGAAARIREYTAKLEKEITDLNAQLRELAHLRLEERAAREAAQSQNISLATTLHEAAEHWKNIKWRGDSNALTGEADRYDVQSLDTCFKLTF